MATISPLKSTNLRFNLNILGSQEQPSVRLMMNFSEDYSVALEGSVLEGVATVKVPHMPFLESINATSIPAKLEVVVDGQFFVPWQDNLEIKKEVKVESVALEDQTTKEEKTSVSVNAIYEEADSEEEMEEASCPSDDEDKEESETEEEPEEEKKEETVEKKVEPKIEKKKHKDYSNLTLDQFLNSAVSAQEFFGD
jgi:hypothetical protein